MDVLAFAFPTAMASSFFSSDTSIVKDHLLLCSKFPTSTNQTEPTSQVVSPKPILRRRTLLISVLPLSLISLPQPLKARERRNRQTIPLEDYLTSPDGLKYFDVIEGEGPVAKKGSTVKPYEFKVGAPPGKERKRDFVDNPNGLFSAQAAPKPPPAMYSITEGMKVGGKRKVIVPPEAGYGKKGMNEIPPGASFELNVELLELVPPEAK
ncbi:peptidyl-prolyl cis-trans isomerase FKBP18, chloroplastic isoform X4 [Malania oleifera]|uniref:peptidyl-prolyl cis-trans isomerase FKBP18, chloroplastic isoform X4 n=1 Tax=Malania oleifera TaxID=397392 RepID=UPI0025ADEA47|nr:peptidyl-prolyl cis-trans isomerase FKBP18, chloroplastic isoform X4 [Malania oleifera]XP_057974489.1 peptidyl-prolyl cis-trans isomerase FKBP18, chloroplastic isoform X4 [Malania oleifera]